MHFDLVDLRLIVAIAEAGSLSRAAAAFPLALSAASNRLRLLEQRCGIPLFTRAADGMAPTPAGRIVLEHARRVVGEADALREVLRELTGEPRITLRLAGTTVANHSFLPAALGPFLADYPEVDLQLEERASGDVLAAVQAKEVEIGVFDGNLPTSGVISLPFRDDKLVLLVPDAHPLAPRGACALRDAFGYPFVCLPSERAMQRFVENMAMRHAKPLKVRVRAPSFHAIAQLVAQNAGVAMLPEEAALRHAGELPVRIVALEDAWATRELRLCILDWDSLSVHARQLVARLTGTDVPAHPATSAAPPRAH